MMKSGSMLVSMVLLGLCACNRQPEQPASNAPAMPTNTTIPQAQESPNANAAPLNAPAPLAEPKGPIDLKSTEAAGQVVQHYGALIEQRRFGEAETLWGDADTARSFAAELKRYPEAHLEIGDLGEPEGAAGSIYVTMPVTFYGKQANRDSFRRKADVILRRVNDVPGSTEQQRRWHIERIEWGAAA
jgi:hypothetical protein